MDFLLLHIWPAMIAAGGIGLLAGIAGEFIAARSHPSDRRPERRR